MLRCNLLLHSRPLTLIIIVTVTNNCYNSAALLSSSWLLVSSLSSSFPPAPSSSKYLSRQSRCLSLGYYPTLDQSKSNIFDRHQQDRYYGQWLVNRRWRLAHSHRTLIEVIRFAILFHLPFRDCKSLLIFIIKRSAWLLILFRCWWYRWLVIDRTPLVCFCLFSQCRVKQKSLSGFHVVGSSMKNNQFDW